MRDARVESASAGNQADAESANFPQNPRSAAFPHDPRPLSLPFLNDAVAADMAEVDAVLRRNLASDVALVRQVAEYIVAAGGKRLRPAVLLLAAGAVGYLSLIHISE